MEIQRLINNKKGTSPSGIIISAIVIAMVISGAYLAINDFTNPYGSNVPNNLSSTVSYIEGSNSFNDTAGEVTGQAAKEANQGEDYTPLLKSLWKFVSYAKNAYQQIRQFVGDVARELNLPKWFVIPLGTILLMGVIAAIIGATHKYKV